MCIRAVIFDLDNTLIRSTINFKELKKRIIDFLVKSGVEGSLLNESMLNFEVINKAVEDLRCKKVPEESIKGVVNEVIAMLNEAEIRSLDRAELMDGALETLASLKTLGFKIGIVTNGCRMYADKVIEMFSLGKYIDTVVTRDEVAAPKPNPGHLLKALEVLGVRAEESVFVGDHLIDALCAKSSGVRFILFKGGERKIEDSEKVASTVIDDLSKLVSLILHGF
jgi:HAD superfamily hydrolase (TIGR01549 family)